MARHIKADKRREEDRPRIKQAAVAWRVQEIYELANGICLKTGAYTGRAMESCYIDVLNALDATIVALQGIPPKRTERRSLVRSRALVEAPEKGGSSSNCQSDADCPVDYICDENQCWYLFGDA